MKKYWIGFIIIVLAAAGVFVYVYKGAESRQETMPANQNKVEQGERTGKHKQDKTTDQKINDLIHGMSVEEKVGQLFFVTPEELTDVEMVVQAGEVTCERLQQYPVGGIIYFAQNIVDRHQLADMIRDTQSFSKIPLFIGIDEEGGGDVARIANSGVIEVPRVPDMCDIGATGDTSQAYEAGKTIGTYLSDIGFNVDFAPVADILTNPENTVIGGRAFGSDAGLVSQMVAEEVKGLLGAGVSAVLKHFPGHGGTATDSHEGAAVVDASLEELKEREIVPFKAGIEAGADFVLAGHLQVPNLTGDQLPATLSPVLITEVLRKQMGYNRIVITDSMSMEAITDYYKAGEAAVKAIQAGVDMILMPEDFKTAYAEVVAAVNSGTIAQERLDESVKRILTVKYCHIDDTYDTD